MVVLWPTPLGILWCAERCPYSDGANAAVKPDEVDDVAIFAEFWSGVFLIAKEVGR